MLFRKTAPPVPVPRQHTLTLKLWPPELKGENLGVVGVVIVIVAVIAASAFGVPIATAAIEAVIEPAQAVVSPGDRPPDHRH